MKFNIYYVDKLDRFKQFIEKEKIESLRIQKEKENMAKEILKEFFSEELKIIDNIQSMKIEWEDNDVSIITYIMISNQSGNLEDLGAFSEPINLIDIFLQKFGRNCDDIIEMIEYWKKWGHGLCIYLNINKLYMECLDKLSKRIQVFYPHLNVSTTMLSNKHYDYNNIKILFP